MKLHLPKALLTAVLATYVLAPQSWAGWASDGRCNGYIYYYDEPNASSTIEIFTLPTETNGVTANVDMTSAVKPDKWQNIYMVSGYGGGSQPQGYAGQNTTIGKVVADNNVSLTIAQNPWQGWKYYDALTIGTLEYGEGNGSGSFNVTHANDKVAVNAVSGCLSSVTNAGNLTLGAAASDINLSGAIVNTGSMTLNGTFTFDVSSISNYTRVEGSGRTTIVDANENGNGFLKFVDASYYLVNNTNGTQLTASTATFATSNGEQTQTLTDGSVITTGDEVSTIYSIVSGSETYGGNSPTIINATEIQVSKGAELVLAGDYDIRKITGGGALTLAKDYALADGVRSVGTGTLKINSGVTLTVGGGKNQNASIASYESVELNGGTLKFLCNGSTAQNLLVSADSILEVKDMNSIDSIIQLSGTTTLNANLDLAHEYKGTLKIGKLTGSGDLSAVIVNNWSGDALRVAIDSVADYSGVISYDNSINQTRASLVIGASADSIVNLSTTTSVINAPVDLNGQFTLDDKNGTFELYGEFSGLSDGENGFEVFTGDQYYLVHGDENSTIDTTDISSVTLTSGVATTLDTETVKGSVIFKGEAYENRHWNNVYYVNTTVASSAAPDAVFLLNAEEAVLNIDTTTLSNKNIEINAGSVVVGKEGSLLINKANDDVVSLLLNTTGDGTITLSTNATIPQGANATAQNYSTKFSGDLVINNGATLDISEENKDDVHKGDNYDFSSFASVQLDNAIIESRGNTTIKNVSVTSNGATIKVNDIGATGFHLTETTTINGKLNIVSSQWKSTVVIDKLTGGNNAEILNSAGFDGKDNLTIKTIDGYAGKISAAINTLTLGQKSTDILNLSTGSSVENTSGTINIYGQLAGSSTISGRSINIKDGASVSGSIIFGTTVNLESALTNTGTLTFREAVNLSNGITNTGTLNFSKGYSSIGTLTNEGIFNLTGNVTISDMGQLKDSGVVTYSHNDGKDGYITGATYFVVESTGEGAYATVADDSKLLLGTSEIGSITSSGYNLVVDIHNENANSGIYYINTQDLTVDGTETNVAVNATGYVIAKGRTLTLRKNQNTTTMTASKILAEATGEGNITVDVDFTYQGQSKATGTLTINQGKTLKVGEGSNGTSNISSFNAVVLKGATLDLNGSAQEVQNLMVDTAKSTLSIRNKEKGHQIYTLSGTTTLKADLDVIPMENEHGDLVVKNLTGVGNLHASGGNAGWGPVVMKLEKLTNYTGSVSVDSLGRTADINYVEFGTSDRDAAAAFDTLKGLSLSNNAYATIYAKGDSTIENLTLTNGAKLNYITNYSANEYTLSKVVVSGEGNSINLAATDAYYQGLLEINNLTNARTEDGEAIAGAITISGNAKTTDRDVVNLIGGDFVGTITFKGATDSGSDRKHALNIKSATAAANAVINLEALSGNVVALGLAEDTVNVKGITGSNATIYSGEQEYGNGNDFASDTQKSRTLAINTAGVSYENSVAVAANVNLEKRGAGKQTFSGNMSDFNGSLRVMEGELAFTASEALKVNGLYVGPEKTAAAPAASEGANVGILTAANGIQASGAVTLAGGATINGSIDMSAATEVCFDVTVGSAPIQLNGSLTMSTTDAFVAALDLSSMTAGQMLTVFTGLESFTIGNVKSSECSSADLSTWSSTGAVASGQYTVEYQVDNNVGSIVVISHMDVVPEPTTATLSLLALAGLCARRRRRA